MMFEEHKPLGGRELFSRGMQQRVALLQRDADRLFSLAWLRRRLWTELKASIESVGDPAYGGVHQSLRGSFEGRFAWLFFSECQSSLRDVRNRLENSFDGFDPLEDLRRERDELIATFAQMPQSRDWERVRDDEASWHTFARRLPLKNGDPEGPLRVFFHTLDHISLITDVLNGHAADYGLKVDYSVQAEEAAMRPSLTDALLAKAIDAWAAQMVTQSAWAVVYCVVRDFYGYDKAMSQFERDASQLPLTKQVPRCPKETVGKTINNNRYMEEHIDAWPVNEKFTPAAHALHEEVERQRCLAVEVPFAAT